MCRPGNLLDRPFRKRIHQSRRPLNPCGGQPQPVKRPGPASPGICTQEFASRGSYCSSRIPTTRKRCWSNARVCHNPSSAASFKDSELKISWQQRGERSACEMPDCSLKAGAGIRILEIQYRTEWAYRGQVGRESANRTVAGPVCRWNQARSYRARRRLVAKPIRQLSPGHGPGRTIARKGDPLAARLSCRNVGSQRLDRALPKDEASFWGGTLLNNLPCAHPLQVYLDLKSQPERRAEAADELPTKRPRLPARMTNRAADFDPKSLQIVRQTCLTVFTNLEALSYAVTIVGGAVPSLLMGPASSPTRHRIVGTIDLDLSLAAERKDRSLRQVDKQAQGSRFPT